VVYPCEKGIYFLHIRKQIMPDRKEFLLDCTQPKELPKELYLEGSLIACLALRSILWEELPIWH
jgi:hypothetical protein